MGRFGGNLDVPEICPGSTVYLPVAVPGVWGIAFGTGGLSGPRTTLFFAAGPHRWHGASEVAIHGVFGSIVPR